MTLWTVAHQPPLSMGLSRQECWSGLPCPPSEDLPDPGIKPVFPVTPALQVDSSLLSHQGSPHSRIIKYNCTQGQAGNQNAGPREELWAAILNKLIRVGVTGKTMEGEGAGHAVTAKEEWPVGRPKGRRVRGVLNAQTGCQHV